MLWHGNGCNTHLSFQNLKDLCRISSALMPDLDKCSFSASLSGSCIWKKAELSSLTNASAMSNAQVMHCIKACSAMQAAYKKDQKRTVHGMTRRECPHVPPHEVGAILQHQLHAGKDVVQDLPTLIAVVNPNVLRTLHAIFRLDALIQGQQLTSSCSRHASLRYIGKMRSPPAGRHLGSELRGASVPS